MPHGKSGFQASLKRLLNSAAMAVYWEPEQKLDADGPEILNQVEDYIVHDPYFELLNTANHESDIPKGINISSDLLNGYPIEFAHQVTPPRFRVYHDTEDLYGFENGIEIRIEHPGPTEHGHKNPYKQVTKIGGPATDEDHTFHRLEISGRLAHAIPDLQPESLEKNDKLSDVLKKHMSVDKLRPLQLLFTVRTRIWCRPEGDPNTIVEFGIDRGKGFTFDGFTYPIWQIEPELIRGDPSKLDHVSQRLMNHFQGSLTVNLTSKPTPGYNHLGAMLASDKGFKRRIRNLPVDEFHFLAESKP